MENLKKILKEKKFFPSKKMGQNFLNDSNILKEICEKAPDISKYDCVIEVGPGFGAITTFLARKANHLICIELDKRLYSDLEKKYESHPNVQLINDDFLAVNLEQLCEKYKTIIVVANIPYSITTQIILKSLAFNKIKQLYVMVQKEVAGKWGYSKTSNRNASTNIINCYFDVEKKINIKNTCFVPVPKVDSSMVLLTRKNEAPYDPKFYDFMKPFFLAKRKKMLNNIPKGINKKKLIEVLKSFGFDENVRSEELTFEHWRKLYLLFK